MTPPDGLRAGRCQFCGVAPGEVHGCFCPDLPPGMFGSIAPYININTLREPSSPNWFHDGQGWRGTASDPTIVDVVARPVPPVLPSPQVPGA